MSSLENSYSHCRRVARQRARNFYYSFLLLPQEQRDAICALYAFMRRCDDLSDEPGAARGPLERWRASLDLALSGHYGADPVLPALNHAVRKYGIPHEYLHQMIDGVSSDLEPRRFETFEELYRYCYQVASVVGLAVIYIFGFESERAIPLAEKCGIAFQLTNILRDLREDAERGRIYLPMEDLRRFGVSTQDLLNGRPNQALIELMSFEAARARGYYRESAPLPDLVDRRSRPALCALVWIYSGLLDRIERQNYDVFTRRVSLSGLEKSWIVLRTVLGM